MTKRVGNVPSIFILILPALQEDSGDSFLSLFSRKFPLKTLPCTEACDRPDPSHLLSHTVVIVVSSVKCSLLAQKETTMKLKGNSPMLVP